MLGKIEFGQILQIQKQQLRRKALLETKRRMPFASQQAVLSVPGENAIDRGRTHTHFQRDLRRTDASPALLQSLAHTTRGRSLRQQLRGRLEPAN